MSNDILVLNAGSSSIKLAVFDFGGPAGPQRSLAGQVDGIGIRPRAVAKSANGQVLLDQSWPHGQGPATHEQALSLIFRGLADKLGDWQPVAVGHRVVHGGAQFSAPAIVDDDVLRQLETLIPLAPLHEPHNVKAIRVARATFPHAAQIACFDTAFHRTHAWVADTFALPRKFYADGIRRYGFHGLSYEYVSRAMRRIAPSIAAGRVIVAHLGNGASLCAIGDGKAVDTTMGFTPLDGLPMGTRSGQIDPGVLLHLMTHSGMSGEQLSSLLFDQSGLLGLSGISSDMRDLLKSTKTEAAEAVDYFVYHVARAVGSLAAALGGPDGLVFTAGIGEHAPVIRQRVCSQLAWMGLLFDEKANNQGKQCISQAGSRVSAWVVPTDEERMIAMHVEDSLNKLGVHDGSQ
jgi:acetate kinase